MTDEMKQEFTRRITAANRTEMVVITYEIALEYLKEADEAGSGEPFYEAVKHAKRCIEQLRNVLDYNYEISHTLMRLYNFISEELDRAVMRNDPSCYTESRKILTELHEAWSEIADQDDSGQMMQNTEKVYAGLTYGREGAAESTADPVRGFTV